jgi:capsular exopolysaccharide synthesis family protein
VVSANLALAFADAGTPAILVDADLRRPSQDRLFGLAAQQGITEYLSGAVPLERIAGPTAHRGLTVIPAGAVSANPADVVSSRRMDTLLRHLADREAGEGVVVIDASPVLTVTDAIALAPKVDGCVIVVDARRTSARVARRAIEALRQVRAPILGVVLNKATGPEAREYYRYPAPSADADSRTGQRAS